MNSDDRYAKANPYAAEAEVKYLDKLLSKYGLGQADDAKFEAIARSYASRKMLSLREDWHEVEWSIVVTGPDGMRLITARGRSYAGSLRNLALWIFQQEGVSSLDELEVKLDLEAGRAV